MKINQLDKKVKSEVISHIIKTREYIDKIYFSCYERVIKINLILSAGGIVTVLTYMGITKNIEMHHSILLFVLSLVSISMVVLIDFFEMYFTKGKYHELSNKVLKNDEDIENLEFSLKWKTYCERTKWVFGIVNLILLVWAISTSITTLLK